MKTKVWAIFVLVLAGAWVAHSATKALYKISRLSPEVFAVSCVEGPAPQITVTKGLWLVSCPSLGGPR